MQQIRVDPYGIKIMLPKAINYVIKLNALPSIQANILKQEMLSLGGDVAVTRDSLTGKARYTDCLIIGSLSQYNRLNDKLACQPFGLKNLSLKLNEVIKNYEKSSFLIKLKGFKLKVKVGQPLIWGIVNLTPDSFSGDGLLSRDTGYIVDHIYKMTDDGADVIDIGGESTRPGAQAVALKEELGRVIPVIKKIAKKIKVPVSIDTYKPQVAKAALDCGASIINDISGLKDPRMARLAAKNKCAVVIMHSKGKPLHMQDNPQYGSLIDEISLSLSKSVKAAEDAGVDGDKIIIDPGIGFGKTTAHNLLILKKLNEFKCLGKPLLAGPSRKSFIGKILNLPQGERLCGTLSACVSAALAGVSFLRVHDVKEVKQAIKISNSIINA